MNLNIREETEERAAPIRSSPGVRVVETFISSGGESLMEVSHQFEPHFRRVYVLRSYARDRLYISCDPLFNPMVVVCNGRKSEMHHFMGQHPVGAEILGSRVAADVNGYESALFPKSAAVSNTFSISRNNAQQNMWDWKMAIIGAHRFGCPLNPPEQFFLGDLKRALFNNDIYSRISDNYCRGHFVSRKGARGDQEEHEQA